MATFNEWGSDLQEDNIGDVIYDNIENKAKQEAEEMAKDGMQTAGDAAVKTLDKATDHIAPVRTVKEKLKEKLSNNPITRAKAAIKKLKEKAKEAVKKAARDGVRAVGRAAMKGLKALGKLAAKNPVVTFFVIVALLIIMSFMDNVQIGGDDEQTDSVMFDSPIFVDVNDMSDDDSVIVLMDDCVNQSFTNIGELDADKEESAKFIYSVFRSYGFNNASIAGILGNIDIESGLDPSAIEGIFNEYGFLGTKKAEALLSMTNYTEHILFPKYVASGKSINRDGYKATDSNGNTGYYCGMGLVQWTGENALVFLNAAETLGFSWYDMDFQMAYMLSDCLYRPNFFSNWVANQEDDDYGEPTEGNAARNAGVKFAHGYEGNDASDDKRMDAAETWYNIIKEWDDAQVDDEYVDTIVTLATELGGIIEFKEIQAAQYRCMNGNIFDNSSLAAAAVSLAWPTQEQSHNNGTNLYQTVLSTIFPDNYTYKSCDRTVAAAVRWSGTDDDYPVGNTVEQLRYLNSSPKWERVGSASSLSMDDLQPGDVFCLNGHTFLYVGESAIQSAYADEAHAGSDSVSGSLNERSPACDMSSTSIINRNGLDWEDENGNTRGIYDVFRCVDPDKSDTYTSIGSGMTN